MKKIGFVAVTLALSGGLAASAYATNGDTLIGIGPIARSMGGVGVAAPQDAISAVFSNPAAMCFGPYCPGSEFNFAATIFVPSVTAEVKSNRLGLYAKDDSQADPYLIPAIGISMPLSPKWRLGLAAYGQSGMGVDYRNELDLGPLSGEVYTQYQVMKFAPNLAYMVNGNLSVGASIHVDYAALDLENGSAHGYTGGVQLGSIYKLGPVSLGVSYISPQKVTHERVYDFDGDGNLDDLDLEMPQTAVAGIAYTPLDNLLVEFDVRFLNWADAAGYKDFDWSNQWVYALGVQYKPIKKLALRAGFNYGKNPVNTHNGFNAADPVTIQGMNLGQRTFGYEYLRIVGFPAVVETHLGLGIGYELTDKIRLDLGYKHAFANKISETGYALDPAVDFSLSSELSEDSYEFGLSWNF